MLALIILIIAWLPALPIVLNWMFEKAGCTGGVAVVGTANPECLIFGMDFAAIYEVVAGLTLMMVMGVFITAPWVVIGTIIALIVHGKRQSR